ncbi:TrbI F-type domain-containing protein [Enterovibrio norvegicus]|uniref:TrbI F-type domain-containing protein n=1 Tax=Enterovibrio norvegicus TaxID=188144 RepID=A0ABV4L7Z4_9GAMM
MTRIFIVVANSAIFLLVGMVLSLWALSPPQVVTFDLKGTIDSYQDRLFEVGMDDEEHRQELEAFDSKLRGLLESYSHEHNVVIVVPAAVVAGANDRTRDIQHYVINALKTDP